MIYLVMECHPAYAIVLDQEGRVIRVANMGYEPGQKLLEVIALRSKPLPLRLRLAPFAAAACLLAALLGGGAYGAYFVPYGTVRIQINPDVRMSVSYMDRVVGLEGLNEDGTRLIGQVSFKGKNAEKMSEILVGRAVDMGYLTEGGTVSIKAQGSSRWEEKRESSITASLDHMLEGRMNVEIKAGAASLGNTSEETDSRTKQPATQHLLPSDHPVAAPVLPDGTGWGKDGDGDDGDKETDEDDGDEEPDRDEDDGKKERDDDEDDGKKERDDDGDDGKKERDDDEDDGIKERDDDEDDGKRERDRDEDDGKKERDSDEDKGKIKRDVDEDDGKDRRDRKPENQVIGVQQKGQEEKGKDDDRKGVKEEKENHDNDHEHGGDDEDNENEMDDD